MERRIAALTLVLTAGCTSRPAVGEADAPVLYTLDPPVRDRIVESIGSKGVLTLERSQSFELRLYELPEGVDNLGLADEGYNLLRSARISEPEARADLVRFFYSVAGSELPPCKCAPILSYRVQAKAGDATARVLGDTVSLDVEGKRLRLRPSEGAPDLAVLLDGADPI